MKSKKQRQKEALTRREDNLLLYENGQYPARSVKRKRTLKEKLDQAALEVGLLKAKLGL